MHIDEFKKKFSIKRRRLSVTLIASLLLVVMAIACWGCGASGNAAGASKVGEQAISGDGSGNKAEEAVIDAGENAGGEDKNNAAATAKDDHEENSGIENEEASGDDSEEASDETGADGVSVIDTGNAVQVRSTGNASGMFSENQVEWLGKKYRRNTYVKAILCIGIDKTGELSQTTHAMGGCADCVFLLVQDTARGSFKVLMIPRDTMTDITMTDLSGNELGKGLQHLLLAYSYGDGQTQSCDYMAEAVSNLLKGLTIDHYAAVNLDVIAQTNDMVGGVTVTVPTEGMEAADPAFVKGETITLKGKQAADFVHYRDITKSNTALYRMDQHQEYIKGFFESVKRTSRDNPGIVEQLFDSIQGHLVTDMSKDQFLRIGVDALNMGEFGDADIFTTPGYGVSGGLYDEFYVNEDELIPVILQLFYREA